ncbi:MAG: tail sheath stabilizer and completion protein, partial [Candidatus Dormibacteria bacterium]
MGSLLNGIEVIQYDANTRIELARITVPVKFEGKETFIMRLLGDPTALKGVQLTLPIMSYDLVGFQYDTTRKLTPYIKNQLFNASNNTTRYACAVPYNINFEVNLYVRNEEDGLQVIEQIIPFFSPDYTIALKYVLDANSGSWITEQVPFVLENINFSNQYEGATGTVRMLTWTLNFTAKALFFGPMPSSSVIKEVIINLYDVEDVTIGGNTTVTMT